MSTQSIKRKLRNPIHNPIDWAGKFSSDFFETDGSYKPLGFPISFNVTDEFKNIKFKDFELPFLSQPSGLTQVLLYSNYWKKEYRNLDFTGTTCEQAIKKILTFYKHKTYRRNIKEYTHCYGVYIEKGIATIDLHW
jgi:hypothetical protein